MVNWPKVLGGIVLIAAPLLITVGYWIVTGIALDPGDIIVPLLGSPFVLGGLALVVDGVSN